MTLNDPPVSYSIQNRKVYVEFKCIVYNTLYPKDYITRLNLFCRKSLADLVDSSCTQPTS